MKGYHHLSDCKRHNISLFLGKGTSVASIARELGLSRSTVQREIIRNRSKKEDGSHYGKCPLLRHKYSVCNACPKRTGCLLTQYIYNGDGAHKAASYRKHTANSGPRIPLKDFLALDDRLYSLVAEQGQSVEAAWHSDAALQAVCTRTVRRWIDREYTRAAPINLRRKKRRRYKAEYDYSKRKKSLNYSRLPMRTMEDYLEFMRINPDALVIQTDSVEGKRGDRLAVLTVYHLDSKLQAGYLYNRGNSANEVYGFLERHARLMLESSKGGRKIVFLTDNGVEFAFISRLEELSPRVRVFFARPYRSTDKACCERNHEFYRYVVPKGHSFDTLTQQKVEVIFSNINSYVRESLDWKSPCSVAAGAYGDEFLRKAGISRIPPKEVMLRPLF